MSVKGRELSLTLSAIGQNRTFGPSCQFALLTLNRDAYGLHAPQCKPISRKLAIMRSRPSTKRGWLLRIRAVRLDVSTLGFAAK